MQHRSTWLFDFEAIPDRDENGFGDDGRDAVPDHPKAVPYGRMEDMIIREALESSGLPHGDDPMLGRVNGTN